MWKQLPVKLANNPYQNTKVALAPAPYELMVVPKFFLVKFTHVYSGKFTWQVF